MTPRKKNKVKKKKKTLTNCVAVMPPTSGKNHEAEIIE